MKQKITSEEWECIEERVKNHAFKNLTEGKWTLEGCRSVLDESYQQTETLYPEEIPQELTAIRMGLRSAIKRYEIYLKRNSSAVKEANPTVNDCKLIKSQIFSNQ